jgi:hypothetical protein
VVTSNGEIDKIQKISKYLDISNGSYSQSYIRLQKKFITQASINKQERDLILQFVLLQLFSASKSFFMHLSAVIYKNNAYIFLGRNGSGKSTIVKLLKSPHVIPFCDDVGILKEDNGEYKLYQSPFKEKNDYKKDKHGYHIKGVYLLGKSKEGIKVINTHGHLSLFLYKKIFRQMLVFKDKSIINKFVDAHKDRIAKIFFKKERLSILQLF